MINSHIDLVHLLWKHITYCSLFYSPKWFQCVFFVSRNFIRNGIVVMTFLILRRNIHVRRRENGCVSWGRVSVIPCLICFTTIFELQDIWNIIFSFLFSHFFSWLYQNQDSVTCLSLYRHTGPSHLLQLLRTVESQNTVQKSADDLWCCLDKTRMPQIRKTKTKEPIMIFFAHLHYLVPFIWIGIFFYLLLPAMFFLPRTPFETSIVMS